MAAVLWGIIGPLSRLAFQEGIAPMEVAFWRAVLTWIFFASHAAVKGETHLEPRDIPMLIFFGISGVSCFYGVYQLAVNKGGAALASVLLYTAPAWVAVMSRFFFKETMTPVKLIALVMTLAGVAGISFGGGDISAGQDLRFNLPAILFGLASGFCYALYYILGKHFSNRYTSPNLFLYILPIGAITLFPWVPFAHKTLTAWTAMGLLAFLSTYGAYFFYYLSLQYLEPTRAAITATLEPVMAAIVAYFWWNEFFSFTGYVGSFLILSSVVLMIVLKDGARDEE
jgi:DME family drug/metabolite transporter